MCEDTDKPPGFSVRYGDLLSFFSPLVSCAWLWRRMTRFSALVCFRLVCVSNNNVLFQHTQRERQREREREAVVGWSGVEWNTVLYNTRRCCCFSRSEPFANVVLVDAACDPNAHRNRLCGGWSMETGPTNPKTAQHPKAEMVVLPRTRFLLLLPVTVRFLHSWCACLIQGRCVAQTKI